MFGTQTFEAVEVRFVLLANNTNYKYLATSTGQPFEYFLNPAVYGSLNAEVRWDAATNAWVYITQPSNLDDRYTVGASGLAQFTQKQPLGSALPGMQIKVVGGTAVTPDFSGLELVPAYQSAEIHPVLLLKVYEQRLASYDYYTYVGNELSTYTVGGVNAILNAVIKGDQTTAISSLLAEWVSRLKDTSANTQLRYNLKNVYGANYDVWKNQIVSTGTNVDIPATFYIVDNYEVKGEKVGELSSGHLNKPAVLLPGLTKVLGSEYNGFKPIRGVYHLFARPESILDLNKVAANTIATLLAGITGYAADVTVVAATTTNLPNLNNTVTTLDGVTLNNNDLVLVKDQNDSTQNAVYSVSTTGAWTKNATYTAGKIIAVGGGTVNTGKVFLLTLTSNILGTVAAVDYSAQVTSVLADKLGNHVYDFYRGSESTVEIPTAFDANGNVTATKKIKANVFFGFYGNSQGVAQVSLLGTNGSNTTVSARNVNLGDTFSYYTESSDKTHPFPTAYQLVTGPYGATQLVDANGKSAGFVSDAYTI